MQLRLWDRHTIKAALGQRGLTLVGVARAAGLEPSSCKVALRRRHKPGEAAIAAALGVNPAVLWPTRYNAQPLSHAQISRLGRGCASPKRGNSQTQRAAQ